MTAPHSTLEYDRFGPWIDEVRSVQDLPRLYATYPIDFATALVFKVPRNISRRDANADMHLYDHLLIASEAALTVLSRDGDHYQERSVPYANFFAVRDTVNLLDGRLSILTRDAIEIAVTYNGSGSQAVSRLVDHLRAQATAGHSATSAPEPATDAPLTGRDAALLVDFKQTARRVPGLTALAWHDRAAVAPRAQGAAGFAARLAHAVKPMTLHGAIIASDGLALEVSGRRDWLIRGRVPELSSGRLVVPFAAVQSAASAPHPHYAGVSTITVTAASATVPIYVPEGSSAARAILSAFPTSAR